MLNFGGKSLACFRLLAAVVAVCAVSCAFGNLESGTISISIAGLSLDEHDRDSADVTVTLSAVQDEPVKVELVSSGTAKLDADFDLEPAELTIATGETEAVATLVPIRDWTEDGDEDVVLTARTHDANGDPVESDSASITIIDNYEDSTGQAADLRYDLFPYVTLVGEEDTLEVNVYIYNLGAETGQTASVLLRIFEYPYIFLGSELRSRTFIVPQLDSSADGGSVFTYQYRTSLFGLNTDATFIGRIDISVIGNSNEANPDNNIAVFGFSLDDDGNFLVRCAAPDRSEPTEEEDPLLEHQWHIKNNGQLALSSSSGVVGADLRMDQSIEDGYTGSGVRVAVVDTGLEICHPDLADNIEPGASVNFLADAESASHWFGAMLHDPFNPESVGDHGTVVAGVIGAVANNGRGGRGVAPGALLRGYNFLQHASGSNLITSIGGGDPRTNTVDVVNMSYGALLAFDYRPASYDIFSWGSRHLRQGLGALFIKAAGNRFFGCDGVTHDIHKEIGCMSAVSDYTNNLPFILVVGAFNAQDRRSSYSSVGSNLWITAPAGQIGSFSPALITTDQFGDDRGYGTVYIDPLVDRTDLNPTGDYTGTFTGTSAASAAMSGVVALLLEVQPELSWRDVKHILASTARRIEPELRRVRIAINDTPYVMQDAWTTNAAGYAFHNWFGFGAAHVDDAVAMAEEFDLNALGQFAVSDWIEQATEFDVPDNDGGGALESMTVARPLPVLTCSGNSDTDDWHCVSDATLTSAGQGDEGAAITIEGVQLRIHAQHDRFSDLGFSLISPQGTASVVNPVLNNGNAGSVDAEQQFHWLTNAFYGESPVGIWHLKVVDVQPEESGSIHSWSLKFFTGSHTE